MVRPPGVHCWNTYLRWVGSLRFICGSGTRRFHLRMFGPHMGSGVPPIVSMPQWWSRRWPPWDALRRQKVALRIISLCVHFLPLRVAPMSAVKYVLHWGLPTCIRLYISNICFLYIGVLFVSPIWYQYLFWLNIYFLSLSLSLVNRTLCWRPSCQPVTFLGQQSWLSHMWTCTAWLTQGPLGDLNAILKM